MPRRVIYIKNPKDGGSHFRTLNGGGGSSSPRPKTSRSKSPSNNAPSNSSGASNSYMPGYHTPTGWGHYGNVPNPTSSNGAPSLHPSNPYIITNYGPSQNNLDMPPSIDWGMSQLTVGELATALTLYGGIAFVALPAGLAGASGVEGFAAISTEAGAQAGTIGIAALAATGTPLYINDGPYNTFENGQYVTHYADAWSWITQTTRTNQDRQTSTPSNPQHWGNMINLGNGL